MNTKEKGEFAPMVNKLSFFEQGNISTEKITTHFEPQKDDPMESGQTNNNNNDHKQENQPSTSTAKENKDFQSMFDDDDDALMLGIDI